jgi:hypothetical protein
VTAVTDFSSLLQNLANFDEVVSFDLATELNGGRRTHRMADLFESSPTFDALRERPQRVDYGTEIVLSTMALDRFAGRYSPKIPGAESVQFEIVREGNALRVENPGQPHATLFPESETSFRIAPDRGTVTFELASDGTVTGLTLHKQIDLFAVRLNP